MSASASKKKRKELDQQGLSTKALAEQKVKAQKNKTLKTALIVALVVVVAAAAIVGVIAMTNAPSYDTKAAVATVGDETVTVPFYNYYYNQTATNFYSQYASFIQAGVPLSQQNFIFGGGTVEENLINMTNSGLQEVLNLYAKAKADGYQLSDEEKSMVDQSVESAKTEADYYGFANVDKYIKARFGEGCNLSNYKDFLNVFMTSSSYASKLSQDFAPTQDEIDAAYQENPNNFDQVGFTYVPVTAEATAQETGEKDENGEPVTEDVYTDEAKAEARAQADSYVEEMPETANTVTYNLESTTSVLGEEAANWLFDTARKDGDAQVFPRNEDETSFYVVRYDSRTDNSYFPVDANIITITKDTAEVAEGEQTAEEKWNALQEAVSDGMTDEEFNTAVTALGYSGVANPVYNTYSDQEIRDYLYNSDRKAGDLLAIETDTAYVLARYAALEETTYRDTLVKNRLWNDFYNSIVSSSEIQIVEDMMQYANTDLTFNASNATE